MSALQKKLIKSFIIKQGIPKEKQKEVFAALDSLDLDTLMKNPQVLLGLRNNPEKLNDYVVQEAVDEKSDVIVDVVDSCEK